MGKSITIFKIPWTEVEAELDKITCPSKFPFHPVSDMVVIMFTLRIQFTFQLI